MVQKNKLHVVHIIPTLAFGGAERVVVDLANNIDQKKFKTSIILFFDDQPLRQMITADVDVHVVSKKGKISVALIAALKKKLSELKPDIVHTHLFGSDVWGRIAASQLGIPVITTEHNINASEGALKQVIKKLLRNATKAYVAPSHAIADDMSVRYLIPKERVTVIYNGIDSQKFSQKTLPPSFQDPLRCLIVGRLVKQKGHTAAIAALAQLHDISWTLTIVGNGEEKSRIEKCIRAYELEDRIMILPATTDIASVYKTHDVVLVPSLWEGLGLVVMEAMAAGRLVVASHTGGISELIEQQKTGVLVPAGESLLLADTLRWVYNHKPVCKEIAKRAKKYAEQNFDLSVMVKEYERLYNTLVT